MSSRASTKIALNFMFACSQRLRFLKAVQQNANPKGSIFHAYAGTACVQHIFISSLQLCNISFLAGQAAGKAVFPALQRGSGTAGAIKKHTNAWVLLPCSLELWSVVVFSSRASMRMLFSRSRLVPSLLCRAFYSNPASSLAAAFFAFFHKCSHVECAVCVQ